VLELATNTEVLETKEDPWRIFIAMAETSDTDDINALEVSEDVPVALKALLADMSQLELITLMLAAVSSENEARYTSPLATRIPLALTAASTSIEAEDDNRRSGVACAVLITDVEALALTYATTPYILTPYIAEP